MIAVTAILASLLGVRVPQLPSAVVSVAVGASTLHIVNELDCAGQLVLATASRFKVKVLQPIPVISTLLSQGSKVIPVVAPIGVHELPQTIPSEQVENTSSFKKNFAPGVPQTSILKLAGKASGQHSVTIANALAALLSGKLGLGAAAPR